METGRGTPVFVLVFSILPFLVPPSSAATWSSVKTGPFLVFSQSSPKETREAAAILEQFRFSLGELLGRHDLTVRPQLQLFLYRDPSSRQPKPSLTRTGAIALEQAGSLPSPETLRAVARVLLDQNIGRIPAKFENGLAEFLSTTQVKGAHVIWGAPPPQMDDDWALIDWLVTNPDTYGKVRVLLANVENNVDEAVSFRNALGKSPADVGREVQAFRQRGAFPTIDAPSRPLSPERDLVLHVVEPSELELHFADLLNDESESRYRSLRNANRFKVECEEGLALLAARRNDAVAAAELLKQAIADGSKNASALVEYARIERDGSKAEAALTKAIELDPNSAEAHFLFGQKLTEPKDQIAQLSIATKLAPRNETYWIDYAQALIAIRQWGPAAKAYQGAEQAAATPEEREKMMQARLALEGQRLDFDDDEKRSEEQARQQEIDRLKRHAIAEIRAAEAKANGGTSRADAEKGAVEWAEVNAPNAHADGQLTGVECNGNRLTLTIRAGKASPVKLSADRSTLTVNGPGHPVLSCEDQEPRRVSVAYIAQRDKKAGTAGEAVAVEFR